MTVKLPLFPLHTVLFPRMLLPLHIFEERYLEMIGYCVEHNLPFGVVLIASGNEVGGPATPMDIGTRAQVLRVVDLEDGRKHVIVRGTERFLIRRQINSEPYLVAEVSDYPLETGGLDTRLLAKVEMDFYRYLRLLKRAQGISVTISNLPEDAEGIAWMVAWGLQTGSEAKQEFLSTITLHELLMHEDQLIDEENRVLSVLATTEAQRRRPPEERGHLSLN